MFNKSTEYQEIYQELELNGMLSKKARFQSYSDSIFTYHVRKDVFLYEFNIIADDCFLKDHSVKELLTMNRIGFFECTIFLVGEFLSTNYWRQ